VTTTTAADQIDLPRHLEQRQIEGSAGKKWWARPPAEIDISPGGARGPSWGLAGGEPETAGGA